jgi:hypothetical protein
LEDSEHSGARLAFEAIGSSVWKALHDLGQSDLAASHLMLAYFEFLASSLAGELSTVSLPVFDGFKKIEQDCVYSMAKARRRYTLLTAIGILDSFLSDSIRFLFLNNPDEIPASEKREENESDKNFIERIVRRSRRFSSQRKRIDFLSGRFSVSLESELLSELEILTSLRNELAHHSGFYRFNKDEASGSIWAQPKPLPEVSQESATKVHIIVTEVCDAILVAMCRKLFGNSPRVRPLTPEVAAVHTSFRDEWANKKAASPKIEELKDVGWSVQQLEKPRAIWVEDDSKFFRIMPTGIDVLPALISFDRNNRHGAIASVIIDDGESEDLVDSREMIEKLLRAKSVLVKFYEEPFDEPRYARFSLEGFPTAWEMACNMRQEVSLRDAEEVD